MTVDTVSEFIRQNGAFGVLCLLIGLFVWRAVPWLADKYTKMQERHDQAIIDLTGKFDDRLRQFDDRLRQIGDAAVTRDREFTAALKDIGASLGARMDRLEEAVSESRAVLPSG